jgi:CheY-like chemotaxis protein/HPt (histidine-containing phosphotransfer) domain-containing protein
MTQPIPVHVLVIDDDAMSLELLAVLLEGEGYSVACADSGEAALELLRQGRSGPSLVLADVQLPGLSGAKLANRLRKTCGPDTLLLAMSGSQPTEKLITPFDGFLMKPFAMEEVAAALSARKELASAKKIPAKRERRVGGSRPVNTPKVSSKLLSIHASALGSASKNGMEDAVGQTAVESLTTEKRTSSSQVLDETIYRKLAGSMPAPQLHEMYAMCMNDARARIAVMRALAAAHEGATFVREAHAIKGGCGMLGATELHGMAAELEKNGLGAGTTEGTREVNSLDELSAACDRLERMLGSRV